MAERPFRDWLEDRQRYGRAPWLVQPSVYAVAIYRFGRYSRLAPRLIRPLAHGTYFAAYSIVRLAVGIEIPRSVVIGPGILIHHFGGIIVHPQVEIGARVTLRHGVTIGTGRSSTSVPTIGDDVVFGANSMVLGAVTVGDRVLIGAMTLVTTDVPDDSKAVGNPAQITTRTPS